MFRQLDFKCRRSCQLAYYLRLRQRIHNRGHWRLTHLHPEHWPAVPRRHVRHCDAAVHCVRCWLFFDISELCKLRRLCGGLLRAPRKFDSVH